uniref:30S ribosomal protein S16 n=1 Tax=Porphyridium purpureum TaxID=35688 RepID=W0RYX6_PORPP|nr:chloroplast 30S ribosomal protein S16 [Porphyridium purpureum]ATJ02869.1 30S ribosomal protein S16 [Porphyridium purpureum]BAO23642.1 chloroplast 30S ribosomal protein S16 [Porphyridium purpureum]
MIKIRLKRYGRKKQPTYRLVVMNNSDRRDGRAMEELGFYNPIGNVLNLNIPRISARLAEGVQPTDTVRNILKKAKVL